MTYDSPTQSPARAQFVDETPSSKRIVDRTDGIVDRLRDELGRDLTMVAAYNADVLEIHYFHETFREQYEPSDLDALAADLCLDGRMGDAFQEELLQLGQFNFVVKGFDDGLLLRAPLSDGTGVAVSTNLNAGEKVATVVPRTIRSCDIRVVTRDQ
ncbi:hypothetical protein [Haloarchaeobius sp. FL176]|uniref:hypothetical protein n=1 Tax=Haloarchaeobius sp. FL176 TaxID=2967129 RepID=UPI00214870A7|nr:hypothetical protein [Haloarchaeobius sp. FL176]